ncbi:hypothetical protein FRC14_008056 [Serendipita sp. 396]|nr:hypothetical protein FRC14_008056 [Serendipita sp. 396]KAG8776492.1 hypothetical protein FRC15_011920 [Serendipita sp. 397]KAG8792959.1 hypothetical protein FRC16_011192 [Serendipita sp. 398]KAG8824618.1 hypothetical protein FRC19_001404 [Serendipita sp. 401]KAG8831381.1 hypothetical protein FRC18_006650 [Serendipita sp. 400]KAG8848597.1 hypothetical protein FRB91_010685 [Serendipita sp. 411]KAG9055668.1 hypothetical protein FS842_001525 [Serendipita sp. 407]
MARTLTLRPVPFYKRIGGFSAAGFQSWRPALALWGVGTGVTLSLLLSNTPIFKNDVLTKIPLFGNIWVDNTPAEDKPF